MCTYENSKFLKFSYSWHHNSILDIPLMHQIQDSMFNAHCFKSSNDKRKNPLFHYIFQTLWNGKGMEWWDAFKRRQYIHKCVCIEIQIFQSLAVHDIKILFQTVLWCILFKIQCSMFNVHCFKSSSNKKTNFITPL